MSIAHAPTPARTRLINTGIAVGGAGGIAATGLVAWFGAVAIGQDVLRASWAIPATIALHLVQQFISALAWRLLNGSPPPSLLAWFQIRWIRESVNSLLPVAQLGGNLAAIRLLAQRGLPVPRAAAGTILDVTVEALTQFLFTLLGVAVLAAVSSDHAWRPWLGGGLGLMGAGIAGFVLAQRAGLLRLIEALASRMSRFVPAVQADTLRGLHDDLMRLQRDRGGLLQATALHLLAWMLGAAETWLALLAMGQSRGALAALVIESLGMAARSAGFAVPGALGIQEGGFVLAAALFGIPPDSAIALSMVKRLRELAVGVPGLLAWQWTEGRRFLRRAR